MIKACLKNMTKIVIIPVIKKYYLTLKCNLVNKLIIQMKTLLLIVNKLNNNFIIFHNKIQNKIIRNKKLHQNIKIQIKFT